MEVAAGIWGLSNRDKVQTLSTFLLKSDFQHEQLRLSQVVNDVTEFYKQTYNNYKDTKQEALKETLRLIHFGVRTQNITFKKICFVARLFFLSFVSNLNN